MNWNIRMERERGRSQVLTDPGSPRSVSSWQTCWRLRSLLILRVKYFARGGRFLESRSCLCWWLRNEVHWCQRSFVQCVRLLSQLRRLFHEDLRTQARSDPSPELNSARSPLEQRRLLA